MLGPTDRNKYRPVPALNGHTGSNLNARIPLDLAAADHLMQLLINPALPIEALRNQRSRGPEEVGRTVHIVPHARSARDRGVRGTMQI